jgi:hypothetical protein
MIKGLTSIARDRARMERDRVVLSSMIHDMNVNDMILDTINDPVYESGEEDVDIEKLIETIPESTPETEEIEIDRILNNEDGATIDEILDVQDSLS